MNQKNGPYESSITLCKWAMRYGYDHFDMSPTAKLAGGAAIGSGFGLVGLDGAAQAGMVLCEVENLQVIDKAFVIAVCAPVSTECKCGSACCRGWRENRVWREAINFIGQMMIERLGIDLRNVRLRNLLVEKHFGKKHKFTDIGIRADVDRKTAAAHYKTIDRALTAEEYRVWVKFEERLRDRGMVGLKNPEVSS
ncbi:hypothetical protein [Burkholderia gladioli]|uniref:hypothetical protein n=1 Tax=Burkholderia gladioli TaxID=28095 RepID=UPI00164001CF|nr:hypothetical protein [Burkholderia gladioli]